MGCWFRVAVSLSIRSTDWFQWLKKKKSSAARGPTSYYAGISPRRIQPPRPARPKQKARPLVARPSQPRRERGYAPIDQQRLHSICGGRRLIRAPDPERPSLGPPTRRPAAACLPARPPATCRAPLSRAFGSEPTLALHTNFERRWGVAGVSKAPGRPKETVTGFRPRRHFCPAGGHSPPR